MPISWEMAERRPQVNSYYRALAALRHAHPALTRGSVRWLHNSDEARVLSYERAATGESLVIAVNLSSQPWSGLVDVPAGEYEDITPENAQRTAALPGLFLAPWQFRIFRRQPR
jgi:glycosidase